MSGNSCDSNWISSSHLPANMASTAICFVFCQVTTSCKSAFILARQWDPVVQHEALKSLRRKRTGWGYIRQIPVVGKSITPVNTALRRQTQTLVNIVSGKKTRSQMETYGDAVYPRHGALPTPPGPPGEQCLPIRQTSSPQGSTGFLLAHVAGLLGAR